MNSKALVLDSFALIAYFKNEEGAKLLSNLIDQANENKLALYIHLMNWGEIYYKAYKKEGPSGAKKAEDNLNKLPLIIEDIFNRDFVKSVGKLKGTYPLSYADAFAVNLALTKKAPVVTGDPELTKLSSHLPNLNLLWV